MFEHFIMGISSMPAPFSPGPLSNVSPGTMPMNSYFPAMPRRPSAHRLSSLGGLESALEAMERKPGNEIEKDDVDKTVCAVDNEIPMFLASEEKEKEDEEVRRRDAMTRRRHMRDRETRRLAMIESRVGCASAQQFVERVEGEQEELALAFRGRLREITEAGEGKQTAEPKALETQHTPELESSSEFSKPRRHSVFHPPGMQDLLETPHVRRASMTAGPRCFGDGEECPMPPDPSWLKAYNNVISKAHFVERRNSLGKGGVLHARVQKKICGRRGI